MIVRSFVVDATGLLQAASRDVGSVLYLEQNLLYRRLNDGVRGAEHVLAAARKLLAY